MIMKELFAMNGVPCSCGKVHHFSSKIISGSGTIKQIADAVIELGTAMPYIISDKNTFTAAGAEVCRLLDEKNISYSSFIFDKDRLEPDEATLGAAMMHFNTKCDVIIAVGSGVINDTAKLVSTYMKLPMIVVATAPSMDGYASMSASMTMDGLKTSISCRCADIIIGDTDILSKAPLKMLLSGVGDMLAKYVSICEWRIAAKICGEYYCEKIAELIRNALKVILSSADALLTRDADAVQAVFDGLSIGSVAMNYAGISRPASGVEHYISHILDMRAISFGTDAELHGIQCAIGTRIAIMLYERLKTITPNKDSALKYVSEFKLEKWNDELRSLLGDSASSMIALEKSEKKYDRQKHSERIQKILGSWDEILCIIKEELPSLNKIDEIFDRLNLPKTVDEIGIDADIVPAVFKATKDIRDKYVLSRLLWDIGLIDEFAKSINK